MRLPKVLLVFAVGAVSAFASVDRVFAASTFTVAGFTFDQLSTPDTVVSLTGAPFSAGGPTIITQSVGFAAIAVGGGGAYTPGLDNEAALPFDPELSIGQLSYAAGFAAQTGGGNGHYATALNMPNGNVGTTIRHGVGVSWSSGQTLANLSGDDFAIYESGSNSASPEGFIVRAELVGGGFTNWYYQANDGFQLYFGEAAEGSFVHQFDLSDMGLASGAQVSSLQIANLIAADTLNGLTGTRSVFLNNNSGTAHGLANGALDPDPLYVGITSGHLVPEPSTWLLAIVGTAAIGTMKLRRKQRIARS